MRFQCPNCQGIVAIEDNEAGQAVACGHCSRAVVVPATRFSPGAVISDFVIAKELGKGGVGVVYLAKQLSLARMVALKILNPRFSADQEYVADFVREARAAALLNHPNIVQAYAVGEEEGVFYFAMEYVEGMTLKQVLALSGRLPVERAVAIITQINAALDFAWTNQKLVHRDIKPDNIIFTDDGRVKLADLGLARRAADILKEQTEEVMGTPQYISPEALLQKPLDNRSDIYSLGATFYHAITGRFPYSGDTAAEIARKHLTERLGHPKTIVGEIPESVSLVIEIMMAKRPEHRYADSAELARDLDLIRHKKMPKHSLSPQAQSPIDIGQGLPAPAPATAPAPAPRAGTAGPAAKAPAGVTGKAPAAPGSKRLIIKTGRTTPPIAGSGSAALEAGPVVPPAPAGAPTAFTLPAAGTAPLTASPVRQKGLQFKTLAWILGTCALVAVIIAMIGFVYFIQNKNKPPEAREIERLCKGVPKDQVNAFLGIYQAIKEEKPAEQILAKVKAFRDAYPGETPLLKDILTRTTPMVEAEIAKLRSVRYNDEKKEWLARAKTLQDQEKQTKDEQERKRLEEERKERERQAAALRQKMHDEAIAKFKEEQAGLRLQALALGKQGRFSEARGLFAGMAQSREEEFRAWAKTEQLVYGRAEKLANMLPGLKNTLKGEKISIPGKRGRWTITNISLRDITFETRDIDPKTGEFVSKQETFIISDLPAAFIVHLVEPVWAKTGGTAQEFSLIAGSYLMCRGDVTALAEARQRLNAGGSGDSAPLLAELDVLEPLLKKKDFDDGLEKLRFLSNKGDRAKAAELAQYLKQTFPDLYQSEEATITKLLE